MTDIWLISDTHFFHENILKFTDDAGKLVRPGFDNVDQMNECMIEMWNARVKPQDKVWHLGDVAFGVTKNHDALDRLLTRLHGQKRMTLGNHDDAKNSLLQKHFEKIQLWNGFRRKDHPGFTATHIPLGINQLRDGNYCVHGHIHQNLLEDSRYINVCVEHTNYAPVHIDDLIARMK